MSQDLAPSITMPDWLRELQDNHVGKPMQGDTAKLKFVIHLALENICHDTGGPFGAAIFDIASNQLLAVGVNRVLPAGQSWAHAEMTAIAHAQHLRKTLRLQGCMLVSSCEPCAMCYGAIPWSGVEELLFGASGTMARAIHFDEGDKMPNWTALLEKRGITVRGPLLPEESSLPFTLYQQRHGTIY